MLKRIKQWILDLSPACKQASELQSHALDGPLAARQRIGLWIHLRLCQVVPPVRAWQIGASRQGVPQMR